MSVKGIAINAILLLTVGLLVSGILIYQVYRTTTSSILSEHECRTRMVTWCTGCMNVNWGANPPIIGSTMTTELSQCVRDHWNIINNVCNDQAKRDCAAFIPVWDGGTPTTTTTTTTLAPTTCVEAGGVRCRSTGICEGFGNCICVYCYDCDALGSECCCDT